MRINRKIFGRVWGFLYSNLFKQICDQDGRVQARAAVGKTELNIAAPWSADFDKTVRCG